MKVILKMMNQMEKEYIIGIMVINMKGFGKIIKKREKVYFIIIMVTKKQEIIQMMKKQEFILSQLNVKDEDDRIKY